VIIQLQKTVATVAMTRRNAQSEKRWLSIKTKRLVQLLPQQQQQQQQWQLTTLCYERRRPSYKRP